MGAQARRKRRRRDRQARADAALQKLYDQVPGIPGCKGLCWMSCGPAEMSDRERERIEARGIAISDSREVLAERPEGPGDLFWCEALTAEGRCAVYDVRPLTCRLWGATERVPCPYGCQPDGPPLTEDEEFALVWESVLAGGGVRAGVNVRTRAETEAIVAWSRTPEGRAARAIVERRVQHGIACRVEAAKDGLPTQVRERGKRGA